MTRRVCGHRRSAGGVARGSTLQRCVAIRAGTVLPLFAVLLFALLPLMAVVIHTGLLTLTRRQMQTAVNIAAIEGLRFRDDVPASWLDDVTAPPGLHEPQNCGPPDDPPSPEWCNCARRYAASWLVALVFDDDLDPAGDVMQFGAGPKVALLDGTPLDTTDFRAGTRISLPAERSYKPRPEQNHSDVRYGDMAAGQWNSATGDHSESSLYVRSDFLLPEDSNYVKSVGDNAFLVRLRRTDNSSGLDEISGVSTHGGPLPFLFGRGPYGGEDWLNRRDRGTIVRATGIAALKPALSVGVATPPATIGIAPVWVLLSSWESDLMTEADTEFLVDGATLFNGVDGATVPPTLTSVGDVLMPELTDEFSGAAYVPIYVVLPSGARRVVGFGTADVALTETGGTITKRRSRIAYVNAAAQWRRRLAEIDDADVAPLLEAVGTISEPLLAPVLVRSVR